MVNKMLTFKFNQNIGQTENTRIEIYKNSPGCKEPYSASLYNMDTGNEIYLNIESVEENNEWDD